MAGPLLYFVAVAGAAGAKQAFKFATKKAAQAFAKRQGGKVVTKPPSGATIKPGPNPAQPRSPSTGRVQKPSPSPAPRKTTTPKKRDASSSTSPAKPKVSTGSASRRNGRKPNVTTTTPKKPSRPGDNARTVGSSSSKPSGRDYSMKSRTNAGPRRLSGNPASLRTSEIVERVPEVATRGIPSERLDRKGETPKKKVTPTKRLDKKGETPKAAPKKKTPKTDGGTMTLRKYLNDAIAERGSSVTAEKKGAEKYGSISAAKKAGSLYYKNRNTGKLMAAVYKEDLNK
tara:strand:- start:146 stop:1003 length:858 start_codon:yes stop_codon:yes gene_type:complete